MLPARPRHIAAGGSAQATVTVNTNTAWTTAYGQPIQVTTAIVAEANNPTVNDGKTVIDTIAGPTPPPPLPVLSITSKAVPPGTLTIPLVITNTTSKTTNVASNVQLTAQATTGTSSPAR